MAKVMNMKIMNDRMLKSAAGYQVYGLDVVAVIDDRVVFLVGNKFIVDLDDYHGKYIIFFL